MASKSNDTPQTNGRSSQPTLSSIPQSLQFGSTSTSSSSLEAPTPAPTPMAKPSRGRRILMDHGSTESLATTSSATATSSNTTAMSFSTTTSAAAMAVATPNSRKRHFAPSSVSVELAENAREPTTAMMTTTAMMPPTATSRSVLKNGNGGSLKKDDSFDESDTDVGSHNDDIMEDDESYDFQCEEGSDDEGSHHHRHHEGKRNSSGMLDNTPETNNSTSPSVSRVGAKVRRLDLGGDKALSGGGGGDGMDVKKSFYSGYKKSRPGALIAKGPSSNNTKKLFGSHCRIGEMTPVMESPFQKSPQVKFRDSNTDHLHLPSFGSPPSSPPLSNIKVLEAKKLPSMLVCPPSTAKKAGRSRIFHTEETCDEEDYFPIKTRSFGKSEEDDEDISPRDAASFPFFPPYSPCKENFKGAGNGSKSSNFCGRVVTTREEDGGNNPMMPHSPERPATCMKKPSRRTDLMMRSPPKGERSFGRANSFLQMFSQDSVEVDDDNEMQHSPVCPPTTTKFDRRIELTARSPPHGQRTVGRTSSFLQMFSQDSVEGLKNMTMDEDCEDDDFIHRPNIKKLPSISPYCPLRNKHQTQSTSVDLSPAQGSSSFSRFAADFEVVGTLGNGSFGCVYKVRNRMDRRMYAIKAAKREARGISDRDRMLQEVFALAALSDETSTEAMHIVRYHQAWMEGNRLYIQTELCQATLMQEMSQGLIDDKRKYKLLREMLLALDLVHKSGMIHLDIKPENIFIKNDQYKLGDFGLVSKIESHDDVEEGDSRYMSMELLSGDLDDLTKSDIFSLGATLYEVCLGRSLPENGQEWQDIRKGVLLSMPNTTFELQMILRIMMAPDKDSRPSAAELLKKPQLLSDEQRELIILKNQANAANRALDAQMKQFQSHSPKKRAFHRSNTIC